MHSALGSGRDFVNPQVIHNQDRAHNTREESGHPGPHWVSMPN
ncbi:hypothetical protein BJY27_009695 [Streptomyces rapamycinicus]|uniref:Uncharacterized protein n=2 Tax=Streptomyces rapamycinicus TaxID=1226757 RepID=A0A3L8R0B1_STRRN|nr:hypothetical protein [Streptomyces rapamycinicus]RLV72977.1 hypothetical protein D3C57_150660 [Streptomyces rapamycinicus NRRL 5491]